MLFLPILVLEHALYDGDNANVLFSGVLVTWISGVFGLLTGHFAHIAMVGFRQKMSLKSERVSLHFLLGYFFSGSFFVASMAVIYLSVTMFQYQQESQIHRYMSQRTQVLEYQLSDFIRRHQNAVTGAAQVLSNEALSPNFNEAADAQLGILASRNPEFLTFLVTEV